jgi:hypothetical protein
MNSVPQVIECQVVDATTVKRRFHDGWTSRLDLAPALRGPIFGELQRPEHFRQVAVKDGTLVWKNGADICPGVLRYWCELGRVCSQEELDAHFAAEVSAPVNVARVAEKPARYTRKRN